MQSSAIVRPVSGSPWPRRVGATLAVAILIGVVIALALGFRRDPHDIKTGTVGKPAPVFDLGRLDGAGRIRLDDYKGKVVVINFWASCAFHASRKTRRSSRFGSAIGRARWS